MADKSIDADTASFGISAQDLSLLNGAIGACWSWEDQEILWGDDGCVLFGFDYQRNWDSVSVAYTANDISFGRDYALSVDNASFSIDAKDVDLSGVNFMLPADATSIIVSQPSISLIRNWEIELDSGSFDITGSIASLEYSAIKVLDADTIIFFAFPHYPFFNTPLIVDRVIDAETTAYAVTASSIDNSVGKTLTADTSSIAVSVSDIANITGRQILSGTGRVQILGGTLTFSTSEDAQNPVFGSFDQDNIIKLEPMLSTIRDESVSNIVNDENVTESVDVSSSTYRVKAS